MNLEAIKQEVGMRPFRPFAIRLSDGSRVSVSHPEFIGMSTRTVFVGRADGGYQLLDPLHIVAIERPNGSSKDEKKGRRGRRSL